MGRRRSVWKVVTVDTVIGQHDSIRWFGWRSWKA